MARVAVISPPLRVSRDFIDYPYFADLGAVQAAAVLRESGHDVALVDALALEGSTLAPLDDGYVLLGATVAETLARVDRCDAIVVAYTPFHRPPARDPVLAELCAGLRAPIVLADLYQSGQHYVAAAPEAILAAYPEASALLQHEGEDALAGFVARAIAGERGFSASGGEVRALDGLPLPAWDLVDLDAYARFHRRVVAHLGRGGWAFPIEGSCAPLVTSRGCPFRCVHCSSNPGRAAGAPKTQRRYTGAYLDRALAALAARGVRTVHVLDELANVNERHFDELLAQIERHDLRMEIPNGLRADYVRTHHLSRMRARMTTLSVSAETGSQRVATEVVDKQLDLGAIERVAEGAHGVGLPLLVHFMIGLPGETAPEINETLAFATRLRERHGAWPAVQFATPLPGTRLAEMARGAGRTVLPLVGDWGPYFQKAPSIATEAVSLDDLVRFQASFEARRAPREAIVVVGDRSNDRDDASSGARDVAFENVAATLAAERRGGAESVVFIGGEPTLHPALLDLVAHARALGFRAITVRSNGRRAAYSAYAAALARAGATEIAWVPKGENDAVHERATGVAEGFAQACDGARNLVAAGLRVVGRVVIDDRNDSDASARAKLATSLGASAIELEIPTGSARPDAARAIQLATTIVAESRVPVRVFGLAPCLLPKTATVLAERAPSDEPRIRVAACAGCPHKLSCRGLDPRDPGAPSAPPLA